MGATLLGQTILTALILGTLNLTFWFSYILTLIIIGGILILFIYITRIASNEKFKFSTPITIVYLITLITATISSFNDPFFWNLKLINNETNKLDSIIQFYLNLNKFTNYPNNSMIYLTIIYLFVTLIAVVKITKKNKGPLRTIN